jgi:hypothetical protein
LIALIVEVAVGTVLGTSFIALDTGITSKESNFKIIKNIYLTKIK